MYGYIASLLLTYVGGAVALAHPLVGLSIYAIFSLARPQQIFGWAGDLTGISNVIGVATVIGWFLKGLGDWQLRRAWPYVALLFGFLGLTAISTVLADNQELGVAYIVERLKIVVMFLIGLTLVDSMTWVRRLAWTFVGAQGYIGFEMNLEYLRGFNLAAEQGLLGDNNSFAISMVGGLGPAIFLGLASKEWWKKAVAFGCAALILHTVLLTFSRGGMLSLVVTGAVVFVMMPKRPALLVVMLAASLLTVRLMGREVTQRFMTIFVEAEERDGSAESRLELWEDCFELIQQHPFFGIGPSHFPLVAPLFGWPPGKSAHSLWVQSAAELGLPAVFCLFGFNFLGLWKGAVLARRHAGDEFGHLGLYVFSGMAGFMVAAQFVSVEGLELPYFTVLIAAAIAKLHPADEPAAAAQPVAPPRWAGRTS